MRVTDVVGAHGEALAERFLVAAGMQVLDRRWRCARGELDLVLADGEYLVVCEVKTRRTAAAGTALDAVTPAKVARLRRLAALWLEQQDRHWRHVRIDVVAVTMPRDRPASMEHLAGVGVIGRTFAVSLVGLDGRVVEVEGDVASGLPAFTLVGLPDAALAEARDRVRAAIANAGITVPSRRVTVNLSPASLPKAGTSFDLAIAVALLAALGHVDPVSVERAVHLGELGLDGRLRPVRGVLPSVAAAVAQGRPLVVVPVGNAAEARLVPGATVVAAHCLADVVALHPPPEGTPVTLPPCAWSAGDGGPAPAAGAPALPPSAQLDLCDVAGQPEARFALEVAAAGGHHLFLLGPPGAGKTMLAARLPGLLPDLADDQALEVTSVHSVAGTLDPAAGLLRRPPFEDPHHTTSVAALVGGGSGLPRPGAASRAHLGVLFLDEAPEFAGRALDALREPLESGELVIQRSLGQARLPARFQLVMAANPCPCGLSAGRSGDCDCTPLARRRYLTRLSGPLLDRVDLQITVEAVSRAQLEAAERPEPTGVVAARVRAARGAAGERLAGTPWRENARVPGAWLRGALRLPQAVTVDLDRALDRGALTMRGVDRVLRIAWTVADLAGRVVPDRDDVGRGLVLRQGGVGL